MKSRLLAVLVGLGVLITTTPLSAHHSTTMYNMANPSTVTGTVKRFEWTNPHAFLYLEVKDEKSGKVTEWEVELMSLNHLRSYGWTSKTVKVGDMVFATGSPAKSGAPSPDRPTEPARNSSARSSPRRHRRPPPRRGRGRRARPPHRVVDAALRRPRRASRVLPRSRRRSARASPPCCRG